MTPGRPERDTFPPFVVIMRPQAALMDPALPAVLSDDELARAARFLRPEDRTRFQAARIVLRWVLQGVTGRSAASLVFGERPGGKPFLPADPELDFNVSHAGDRIAVAVAPRGERIGVDVERVRPPAFWEDLAPSFLSPRELDEARKGDRAQICLRLWTAKEAALKLAGTGFARCPRSLEIVAAGPWQARVPETGLSGRWLWPDPEHCLCVMATGPQRCRVFRISRPCRGTVRLALNFCGHSRT